ncbi:MAG: AAA family ATPase, partial [Candidatus Heimdallarchaeota archaeon]
MENKVTLFQKITLDNLMLHEYTEVDLAKESITLITGANGSGKTQILDGIIICIGHIPTRAKAKGIGSLVGKNGKHAKVTLELANPIADGRRVIATMDKDLNAVINSDRFVINAKISRNDSSIIYSLNNSRTIIRGRLVSRRDIRRIFESIGVRGDNRLAFTGEGTVDEFASKSAKRKLDVLLDVTGLKQYREEVIASQETLRTSIQEIEPLKRKLETEGKLLNLWNDALNILKQKKKLMIMKTHLQNEMAWSYVIRLEKRVESLNKERLKILKQRSDNESAIQKKDEETLVLKRKLNSLDDELSSFEEQQRVKNRRVITLETQLENDSDNIASFKKEITRYIEQKQQMESLLAN